MTVTRGLVKDASESHYSIWCIRMNVIMMMSSPIGLFFPLPLSSCHVLWPTVTNAIFPCRIRTCCTFLSASRALNFLALWLKHTSLRWRFLLSFRHIKENSVWCWVEQNPKKKNQKEKKKRKRTGPQGETISTPLYCFLLNLPVH